MTRSDVTLQAMQPDQWIEVAALIHDSTNGWYQSHQGHSIFEGGPRSTLLFCEVYETLDPGCCILAKSNIDGAIVGSCFYHPRETHYSLGIMNVHPDAFGRGVARTLLGRIIELANRDGKPVRLVSSAMNLDSFSLYTRAGFVPRQTYQDMILDIPSGGVGGENPMTSQIRKATIQDISRMGELEQHVSRIRREKDYRFFVANESGSWNVSVLYERDQLQGWIVSIAHPSSNMIGPCIALNQEVAIALLTHELNQRSGRTMVFLVPVDCDQIVKAAYGWGARNSELHVSQILGEYQPVNGVAMPTFMPETG